MLASFRARLIAGFALVISLALFLAASGFVLLLRQQEARAAEQRIGLLVGPVSQAARDFELLGWPVPLIRTQLMEVARVYDFRILMLDQEHRVTLDTDADQGLVGRVLDVPDEVRTERRGEMQSFRTSRLTVDDRDLYVFMPGEIPGLAAVQTARAPSTLLIVVPADDVTQSWARLLPRLALAGLGAGAAAVVFAWLLAARITNPIAAMTRASQAMAEGDLDQRIDVAGDDEVGRLASAFNRMSAKISRSDRSMRDLLADVSHELKTPLTSITGFSQALMDGIIDDPRAAGALIHEEAERIRVLVDDLLYLSEIESGTLRMDVEDVDIDALVEASARRFRLQAEEAGVSIDVATSAGRIQADGRRLEQVLANLLDNATRFARRGTAVRVTAAQVANGVLIDVHNEGEPIPHEVQARVFDRFYQADASRSGTRHRGLGLSIVSELVHAHGGTVSVDSSPERGTTFSVFVPSVAVAGAAAAVVAAHRDLVRSEERS